MTRVYQVEECERRVRKRHNEDGIWWQMWARRSWCEVGARMFVVWVAEVGTATYGRQDAKGASACGAMDGIRRVRAETDGRGACVLYAVLKKQPKLGAGKKKK